MQKSIINKVLVDETKRKQRIISICCIIIIIFVLSLSFALIFVNKNQKHYVTYSEDSNVDYDVYLKENDFFENDYLEKDNQYIASLINYIEAKFDYDLSLDKNDVNYKYTYWIDAEVSVINAKNQKALYKKTDKLVDEVTKSENNKKFNINEEVKIDYNKYNDLIKTFVNMYGVDNINSLLKINMHVKVIGDCEEIESDDETESVMSLEIPLTEKTIGIDISNNLVKSDKNVMLCEKPSKTIFIYLILSIAFLLVNIRIIIYLYRYIKSSRDANNVYKNEIKKILSNYGSYIQTIDTDIDFTKYKILKVNEFTDMLEIRDTILQPILMYENKNKESTYFIIPSNTNILYVHRINVNDIDEELKDKLNK